MSSARSLALLRSLISDYDSDLDADYTPSEESSEDELEFFTDAEGSSGIEDSDSV